MNQTPTRETPLGRKGRSQASAGEPTTEIIHPRPYSPERAAWIAAEAEAEDRAAPRKVYPLLRISDGIPWADLCARRGEDPATVGRSAA